MATVYNNLGSETVAIDGNNSVGNLSVNEKQEALNSIFVNVSSTGEQTLGIVPANKIWKVIGYTLSLSRDDGRDSYLNLKMPGNTTIDGLKIYTAGTTEGQATSRAVMFPNGKYIELTAGETIKYQTDMAVGASLAVFYIEESV